VIVLVNTTILNHLLLLLLCVPIVTAFQPLVFVQRPSYSNTYVNRFRLHRHRLQYDSFDCVSLHQHQQKQLLQLNGWIEKNGEWEWIEDDPKYIPSTVSVTSPTSTPAVGTGSSTTASVSATTTTTTVPKLPSGTYKPKQSLGQNYLKDPNTVNKMIHAFHLDATSYFDFDTGKRHNSNTHNDTGSSHIDEPNDIHSIIELGPGAGALTDTLVARYGVQTLHCIEIDERSIDILRTKHPSLLVEHADVLQINYKNIYNMKNQFNHRTQTDTESSTHTTGNFVTETQEDQQQLLLQQERRRPLIIIGNLPYYITSQILFAFADAAHYGYIHSATVTMQWEVGQRMVAKTHTKEYGILSVVFQIYCINIKCHFKIPPTVFYPQPKVYSALLGLHFLQPQQLHHRLFGVHPIQLRRVITVTFQQRRKTIRNSIKSLLMEIYNNKHTIIDAILNSEPVSIPQTIHDAAMNGNIFAMKQVLPNDWSTKRPEELNPGQFIELTRLIYSKVTLTSTDNNNTSLTSNDEFNNNNYSYDDDDDDDHETMNININNNNTDEFGTKVWRKLKHGS
jgi:16S rRNA (adenine1518-N6/adenine1519-N6)-dimethyltransferase